MFLVIIIFSFSREKMEELQKAGGFLENAEFSGTNMKIRHPPPRVPIPPLILTLLAVSWIIYAVVFLIRQHVWNDNCSGS